MEVRSSPGGDVRQPQPLCIVCGAEKHVFPAGIDVLKSKPTILDFLFFHEVVSEERVAAWASPYICEPCYNCVTRCDEFYFAFSGELSSLLKKAASYDARVGDPLGFLGTRIVEKEGFFDGHWDHGASSTEPAFAGEGSSASFSGPAGDSFIPGEWKVCVRRPGAKAESHMQATQVSVESDWVISEVDQQQAGGEGNSSPEVDQYEFPPVIVKMEADEGERTPSSSGRVTRRNGEERERGGRGEQQQEEEEEEEEGEDRSSSDGEKEAKNKNNSAKSSSEHAAQSAKKQPPLPCWGPLRKCKLCYFRTRSASGLSAHVRAVHERPQPTFEQHDCGQCMDTFQTKEALEAHVLRGHAVKGTIIPQQIKTRSIIPCGKCDMLFVSVKFLEAHEDKEHAAEADKMACEHCDDVVLKHRYKAHLASKHKIAPREPLACEFCGAVRAGLSGLKRHLARDHGVGDYGFKSKKFPCPECGKVLANKRTIHVHLFNVHNIETPELADYRFTCDQCGKVIVGKSKFEGHTRMHTGERYVCPNCDYKTRFIGNMTTHRKNVHGYKPLNPRDTRNTSAPGFQLAGAPLLKTPEEYSAHLAAVDGGSS